jgi:hypothetical protein
MHTKDLNVIIGSLANLCLGVKKMKSYDQVSLLKLMLGIFFRSCPYLDTWNVINEIVQIGALNGLKELS